jgi:hypothetical protein
MEPDHPPLSPIELEANLRRMLAYRQLCRSVQRTGRENFFFAVIMGIFAYMSWQNGAGNPLFLTIYALFILGELVVAMYKWWFPAAEGLLGDALIMLAFAGLNGFIGYLQWAVGVGPNPILAFLTALALLAAWRQWQAYRQLRVLFTIRPNRQQLRWFEQFVADIARADPHTDASILQLPDRHGRKVLLLEHLVVIVDAKRRLELADASNFQLTPVEDDTGEKRDWVVLTLYGQQYGPFAIDPASWSNYQRWRHNWQRDTSASSTGA